MIYLEKLSLEVREVSQNVTKTLPNTANPHIGIYREIGQQVLASIEETQTDTQTDVTKLCIYRSEERRSYIEKNIVLL